MVGIRRWSFLHQVTRETEAMTEITVYQSTMRTELARFMELSILDGNDSMHWSPINLNRFDGKIWCCWEDNGIVSMMARENDRDTETPNTGRICRYHILKDYRHGRYGFKMLDYIYHYAKYSKYDMIYWTHDIKNKALNALYQHKRTFADGGDNSFYHRVPFTLLTLDERLLFQVSDKSQLLQYVYYIKFTEFNWLPKKSVIWRPHDGDL